jgi:hypothetical protein
LPLLAPLPPIATYLKTVATVTASAAIAVPVNFIATSATVTTIAAVGTRPASTPVAAVAISYQRVIDIFVATSATVATIPAITRVTAIACYGHIVGNGDAGLNHDVNIAAIPTGTAIPAVATSATIVISATKIIAVATIPAVTTVAAIPASAGDGHRSLIVIDRERNICTVASRTAVAPIIAIRTVVRARGPIIAVCTWTAVSTRSSDGSPDVTCAVGDRCTIGPILRGDAQDDCCRQQQ